MINGLLHVHLPLLRAPSVTIPIEEETPPPPVNQRVRKSD